MGLHGEGPEGPRPTAMLTDGQTKKKRPYDIKGIGSTGANEQCALYDHVCQSYSISRLFLSMFDRKDEMTKPDNSSREQSQKR